MAQRRVGASNLGHPHKAGRAHSSNHCLWPVRLLSLVTAASYRWPPAVAAWGLQASLRRVALHRLVHLGLA